MNVRNLKVLVRLDKEDLLLLVEALSDRLENDLPDDLPDELEQINASSLKELFQHQVELLSYLENRADEAVTIQNPSPTKEPQIGSAEIMKPNNFD
jgi:hypothetical protein